MSTRTGVRALVMVTLCYGALEIVGLLLLLLLSDSDVCGILCSSCVSMWWPPDSDVVATASLSGGHHILSGGHQIKKIFSAVVPAGLHTKACDHETSMNVM